MNDPQLSLSPYDVRLLLLSHLHSWHAKGRAPDADLLHVAPSSPEHLFSVLLPEERLAFLRTVHIFFDLPEKAEGEEDMFQWATSIARQWSMGPQKLCFHSSGSTGTPVPHFYELTTLLAEARALAPLFAACTRVVTVMPVHHIFGCIFSLLLPKVLRIPVIHLPPLPVASFFQTMRSGDLVLAFPFFWQSLLALARQNATTCHFAPGVHGISSTAPCRPDIIDGLKALPTPLAHMTEIYGSTETSGIGFRHNCHGPYSLLPVWKCIDLPEGRHIMRIQPSSTYFSPQLLPDEVDWISETAFFPQKRRDHAVQVGGMNVYPEKIAELIKTHPEVSDCAVRLMRPDEGVRLKAFIVPRNKLDDFQQQRTFGAQLRQWLAAQLKAAARPKSIVIGSELPRNSMGKLADW